MTVWKHEPFEITTERGDDGWYWGIHIGEDWVTGDPDDDTHTSEDDAIKEALAALHDLPEPFREPDYEGGHESLWWGHPDELRGTDSITQVVDDCVSEYRALEEEDQWLRITVCLDEGKVGSHRIKARIGVDQIADEGGDEETLTTREVMEQWPNLVREKPLTPPSSTALASAGLKRSLLQ